MILTCPSCATRYSADAAKFPAAGRKVRCAKCGETWHQPGPGPEELEQQDPIAEPAPEPIPAATPEPVREPTPEVAPRIPDYVPEAVGPRAEEGPRKSWLPMVGIAAGWISLIAAVLLIGVAAVRYRQEIAVIWPQSAAVYSRLGMSVNTHGVHFENVHFSRVNQDGQMALVIIGDIVNTGDRELPVPQDVRITLSDASNHEVYHWNFTPNVQTLKPNQGTRFTTQISSPPAAARHLEVRFMGDLK